MRSIRPRPVRTQDRIYFAEGVRDSALVGGGLAGQEDADALKLFMNECWTRLWKRKGKGQADEKAARAGSLYAAGFAEAIGLPAMNWLPVALGKTAAAVVEAGPCMKLEAVRELARLPLQQLVVVLSDQADADRYAALRTIPGVTIVHPAQAPDADAARALGARLAEAEIVLFADSRHLVAAERLMPLLAAIDNGADIALADRMQQLGLFSRWDEVSRVVAFMNLALGRPELLANSAAALPHAWSKGALAQIGRLLAVPSEAHRAAIENRLNIALCRNAGPIGGKTKNAASAGRPQSPEAGAAFAQIEAHRSALQAAMAKKGSRLELPDRVRRRSAAGAGAGAGGGLV
jgi:hypothetical protein